MRTRLIFCALLLMGCRDVLGIDDLRFDLGVGEGGGGNGGGSGGGGGGESSCAAAVAAETATGVIFWSTLDDAPAVVAPRVGIGPGQVTGNATFVPALSDGGVELLGLGDTLDWPATDSRQPNVRLATGAVDFCVRPAVDHDSGDVYAFFGVKTPAATPIALVKEPDGYLGFYWLLEGQPERLAVAPSDYRLDQGTWYRLTVNWRFLGAGTADVSIYLDGQLLSPESVGAGPAGVPEDPSTDAVLYLGSAEADAGPGVIDELVIYDGPITP